MPITVYTLVCDTDRSRHVLGVFADRARAAEIARDCAAASAAKLRRQDQETFKAPIAADLYEVHVEELGSNLSVSVRRRFLDQPVPHRWQVQKFEIVPKQERRTRPVRGWIQQGCE
jgi:hypothetical protein